MERWSSVVPPNPITILNAIQSWFLLMILFMESGKKIAWTSFELLPVLNVNWDPENKSIKSQLSLMLQWFTDQLKTRRDLYGQGKDLQEECTFHWHQMEVNYCLILLNPRKISVVNLKKIFTALKPVSITRNSLIQSISSSLSLFHR